LEIFGCVLPTGSRARCEEALERLQETLGEFTDHAAAADRLRRWARSAGWGSQQRTLAALRAREVARATAARKAFAAWWNPARRRRLRRALERSVRGRAA
jgi:CHAD domain-containing protein